MENGAGRGSGGQRADRVSGSVCIGVTAVVRLAFVQILEFSRKLSAV